MPLVWQPKEPCSKTTLDTHHRPCSVSKAPSCSAEKALVRLLLTLLCRSSSWPPATRASSRHAVALKSMMFVVDARPSAVWHCVFYEKVLLRGYIGSGSEAALQVSKHCKAKWYMIKSKTHSYSPLPVRRNGCQYLNIRSVTPC